MKKITSLIIILLASIGFGYGQMSDLIISEYGEGTGNNKYIEIYNGTGANVDLSGYEIWRVSNGGTWPEATISLSGTLANGSAYLIANNLADPIILAVSDLTSGAVAWNGNDAAGLAKDDGFGTFFLIDAVGTDGADPGTGWDVAGTTDATLDHTLVRKNNVCDPNTNWSVSAGTNLADSEWIVLPNDNWSNLSIHSTICPCLSTVTWDGANWTPTSPPDNTTVAIIDANYNTTTFGSFSACSLTVNPGYMLTVNDGDFVEVENDVINNGTISVQPTGSFIQKNDAAIFVNSINNDDSFVDKFTAPINAWYEYTYWSSPVSGEQIQDVFSLTNPDRRYWFNAENFLDETMESGNNNAATTGQDDVDDDANDWQLAAAADVLQPGVGYAATLSPISYAFPGGNYLHTFKGPFNNGVFNVPVYRNDAELADTNWNFIGNPYPSEINVDLFFDENVYDVSTNPTGTLDGAIYLWSQNEAPLDTNNGNSNLNFASSDYAMINGTGEASGGDTLMPNRFIPSGQGFFASYHNSGNVISSSINGDGDLISEGEVIFRNSMRTTGNNNQFFRTSSSNSTMTSANKLWLNLTSDNGIFSQILVGYVNGATNDNDGAYYDATRNISTGMSAFMYSIIDGSNKNFAIQGKAPESLTLNEIIPLGIYTTINVPTLYNISIAQLEGDFLSNNTIYLKDNEMNIIYDLSNSDYTFTSTVGDFNNRFEIVFNTNSLSTSNFEINENAISIIELENNDVKFSVSNDLTIKSIKIYDMLGRELYNLKGNSNVEIHNLSNLSSAPYIAQIHVSNGLTISKKAIKK